MFFLLCCWYIHFIIFVSDSFYQNLFLTCRDAAEFDRLVNGILCVLTAVAMYGIFLMHSSLECHCKGQSLVAAKANVEDQNP